MALPFFRKLVKKNSLHTVLLIPFVGLTFLAVAIVGFISYRNGQQAVNDVAHQLRSEINARIEEHLNTFLMTPHRINQANADAAKRGSLDVENQGELEKHFWEQIQVFDSVTSINFGNTEGGLANAGREGAEGQLYVIFTDNFESGTFRKYATDSYGSRARLLDTVPAFDSRERSWYTDAVEKDTDVWSEVYIMFTEQDMAISASRPVYDAQQKLLGVTGVNLFLSHLGDFLSEIDVGQTGHSFIIERSGFLIATSTGDKSYVVDEGESGYYRIEAGESAVPLIRSTAEALVEQFGDYQEISISQPFEFYQEGQRQLGQVTPFQDQYGLDWLIVTVIPETDFMAQINANNRVTIFLAIITLGIIALMSMFITGKLIMPISQLNVSARALAKGEWEQTIQDHSWIEEISVLSKSFNHMAGQLREMVANLTHEIAERKQREEALKASEERYRLLVENVNEAIIVAQDGLHKFVNPRAVELYGCSEAQLTSTPIIEFIHPEDREIVMEQYNKRIAGEVPRAQYSFRIIDGSGRVKWAEISAVLIEWEGRPAALGLISDITERKQAEEKIQYMSFHDSLTGLYNRAYLEQEMQRLDTKLQMPISVIMCDLNGLKLINDTYGHSVGDEMLVKAANILRKACREQDIIARWSGDEFVILLPKTTIKEALSICQVINNECRETYVQTVPLSMALGTAAKENMEKELTETIKEAEDHMNKHKLAESRSTKSAVLNALLKTLEEKSYETEEHARRMQEMALKIGEKIKLPETELDRLTILVYLHDIGKITVPEEVLTKKERLTEADWEHIKKHPETGYRITRSMEEFAHVAEDILCHHEHWDGSGYPKGLKEKEIPLLARITTIVDAYEVMTNGRPYKVPLSKSEVAAELKRCAGTQFDPELVEVFLGILEE